MKITVIGCGRWGSCIAWYLDRLGHDVSLYGRSSSENMKRLIEERKNEYIVLPDSLTLTSDIKSVNHSDTIVISINAQGLRALCGELRALDIRGKTFVLCMKGIENTTCKRLSEVVSEELPENQVAVWLGPGHVEEFYKGIQNCMVIDSDNAAVKSALIDAFSGGIIRFYYGADLVGNEIGAAAKNVIGVAAGMLDGLGMTSLKGALMSRGAREIARLIKACGGNELSAYGLCHLGDYQATVFSEYSHNRAFGECCVKGEDFGKLAEGYYTVPALIKMADEYSVELPICRAVYDVLYLGVKPGIALMQLFDRSQKLEF
ncbi:MAG: NAD(P)H-dependent glycerol-3-phosphate dehydrogenase [Clostridia bacterium]|nr:NAD(P)H-dependent glycerol-3-phosphate dehydrogenase [Clostridia bacterium]